MGCPVHRTTLALVSLLTGLLLVGCGGDEADTEWVASGLGEASGAQEEVLSASQSQVEGAPEGAPVYTGVLEPLRVAEASFVVPGTVKKVHVKMGETVKKGQLLATLETEARAEKLAEARERLRVARSARPGASRSVPDRPPPQWMLDEGKRMHEQAKAREAASAGELRSFRRSARNEGESAARDRAIAMATRRGGARASKSQTRRASEDALALALVDDNEQRVRQLREAIANSTLKAPMGGTVVGITARAGESWNTRSVDAAFDLVDPASFVAEIVIPQSRAKRLVKDELVWVELPALGSSPMQVIRARWLSTSGESSQLAGGAAWVGATFQLPRELPRRLHVAEEVRVVLRP